MKNSSHPPLVMSGLILSLFALGRLLQSHSLLFTYSLSCMAFALYALLLLGIMSNRTLAKEQLGQALIASVFPTFFMAGMLMAGYIKDISSQLTWLASAIWWLSFWGNLLLIIYYCWRFVWPFKWDHVFPSWSVLFVGIAISSLTAPVSGQYLLAQLIFWFCLALTVIILPFMAIKSYKIGLDPAILPNISTFCAPLSLLAAAYLNMFSPGQSPNQVMVWSLLISSQALYFFVLLQLPRLIRRPFNPGFSAFSFPFVISATALTNSLDFLNLQSPASHALIIFEKSLASLLVAYVLIHYLNFLRKTS